MIESSQLILRKTTRNRGVISEKFRNRGGGDYNGPKIAIFYSKALRLFQIRPREKGKRAVLRSSPFILRCQHLIDQHASHCMGKMSESDFGLDQVRNIGFENLEFEPIESNCRFDHLSAKHFRFEDSAPAPIQRSVFATPFRPYKGSESNQ